VLDATDTNPCVAAAAMMPDGGQRVSVTTPHDDDLRVSLGEKSGRAPKKSPFDVASREGAADHRQVFLACFLDRLRACVSGVLNSLDGV
jgi:hypothetical protein